MKSQRRRDLLRILHAGGASSQEEIVEALRRAGHNVTQATVSRDLRDVGAVKVRANGHFEYRLHEEVPLVVHADRMTRQLQRVLAQFVVDIAQADSLVVLKTPPGHASAVARALDLSGLPSVIGTVAGDDTVFIASPGREEAAELVGQWSVNEDTNRLEDRI